MLDHKESQSDVHYTDRYYNNQYSLPNSARSQQLVEPDV
jgi:hypothetical protein